jgi:hypothetical protein
LGTSSTCYLNASLVALLGLPGFIQALKEKLAVCSALLDPSSCIISIDKPVQMEVGTESTGYINVSDVIADMMSSSISSPLLTYFIIE